MFKRRVMILGAVGVLGLAGLAGSAMADETPKPGAEGTAVCTTSDGKTIELKDATKAIAIGPDGKITQSDKLPEPPEGATMTVDKDGRKTFEGKGKVIEFKEAVPAVPAEIVEGGIHERADDVNGPTLSEKGTPPADGGKAFSIKCVKQAP